MGDRIDKLLQVAYGPQIKTRDLDKVLKPLLEGLDKEQSEDLFNKLFKEFTLKDRPNLNVASHLVDTLRSMFDMYYVYLLYLDSDIVYIGSTRVLGKRLYAHASTFKEFNRAEVCRLSSKKDMLYVENNLIYKHKPKYNKSVHLKYVEKDDFKDDYEFSDVNDLVGVVPCLPDRVRVEGDTDLVYSYGMFYRFDEEVIPYWYT